jgi:modification methylase
VRADASVEMKADKGVTRAGSIHQVGAACQEAPSCNGWTFWHVREGGKLVPLDDLRQRYAAGLGEG